MTIGDAFLIGVIAGYVIREAIYRRSQEKQEKQEKQD